MPIKAGPRHACVPGAEGAIGVPTWRRGWPSGGGVHECLDRLAELVAAGAEHWWLNSAFDHMAYLEVLAQDIVPHLAGAVKA